MGKAHRDNHQARKKAKARGVDAFGKKAKRRAPPKNPKCGICGTETRPHKLVEGWCPKCRERAGI